MSTMSINNFAATSNTATLPGNNTSSSAQNGGFAALLAQANAGSSGAQGGASGGSSSSSGDKAVQDFMNFMNESPAERFEDQWLAAHHLSRQDLAKMSPSEREAIMKQIAHDMELAIQQKLKTGSASLSA